MATEDNSFDGIMADIAVAGMGINLDVENLNTIAQRLALNGFIKDQNAIFPEYIALCRAAREFQEAVVGHYLSGGVTKGVPLEYSNEERKIIEAVCEAKTPEEFGEATLQLMSMVREAAAEGKLEPGTARKVLEIREKLAQYGINIDTPEVL